jgi:cytochrome c553
MRGDRIASLRNPWFTASVGLVRNVPSNAQIVGADYPTTRVEIVPQMLQGASAESIGRGATLALRCSMCHGARGLSQADSPNLAGQSPFAIYKQLDDFKTGARTSAVMAPLVDNLSDADMRDLAAYYAYLPRPSDHPPSPVCDPASSRAVHRCAGSRPVGPVTATSTSTTRLAQDGSGDSPRSICAPNSRLSRPALGTTTSASRCATSRQMTAAEIGAATEFYANR